MQAYIFNDYLTLEEAQKDGAVYEFEITCDDEDSSPTRDSIVTAVDAVDAAAKCIGGATLNKWIYCEAVEEAIPQALYWEYNNDRGCDDGWLRMIWTLQKQYVDFCSRSDITAQLSESLWDKPFKETMGLLTLKGVSLTLEKQGVTDERYGVGYTQALLDFKRKLETGGCIDDLDKMISENCL